MTYFVLFLISCILFFSSVGDPHGRRNLNEAYAQYKAQLQGMHPVGRLDCDTSGLLLFSNNGTT